MSLIEKPQLLRNSTNFDNPQSSYRGERNGSSKKNISSEFDDSSPCFGHKQRRKPESNKNVEKENRSFFNSVKEANNENTNLSNNDNNSNNIFEIYEKKQTRDSLMDKINEEINTISNLANSKFQANGNDKDSSKVNNNNNNQICNNFISNGNQTKRDVETNKGYSCDRDCKCNNCYNKQQDNSNFHLDNHNNFAECNAVSFKNPEQLDIVVEKDNKQACCLIYNNNCLIF